MFLPRQCEIGDDTGRWFTVVLEHKAIRRIGYCALGCVGHDSADDALAHHLQYQLDRETDLWLDRRTLGGQCEVCGEHTTLHARLGRGTKLFRLCHAHHTTSSLKVLFRKRVAQWSAPVSG
jgi:hypothetical protein